MIDIDATMKKLSEPFDVSCPAEFAPVALRVMTSLRSQHEVLLEMLGELRFIRTRMTSDVACGFTRTKQDCVHYWAPFTGAWSGLNAPTHTCVHCSQTKRDLPAEGGGSQ